MIKIFQKNIKYIIIPLIILLIAIMIFKNIDHIPFWVNWNNKTIELVTNNNYIEFKDTHISRPVEKIELKNKQLMIYSAGEIVYRTEDFTKVQDFLYFDIDGDSKKDLILLVWEKERYRKYVPFFEENEYKWDQHIFIYNVYDNKISEKWLSSYVSEDITKIHNVKENILSTETLDGKRVDWEFRGFGLKAIKESKFDYLNDIDIVESKVSINCFGDNLIHKKIIDFYNKHNYSFDKMYENIKKENDKSDISIINNEVILVDSGIEEAVFPKIVAPFSVGKAIKNAGFDIVTLGNNHILDDGEVGLEKCKSFYEKNGILTLGINDNDKDCKIIKKNGIKIGMLNYTFLINNEYKHNEELVKKVNILPRDENEIENLVEEIKTLKEKTDVVIMFVHWGTEYQKEIDNFQKKWSDIFLNAGIDIVIGSHPHVLQKKEILKNNDGKEMLIYYSLGNFISHQTIKETAIGGEAKFDILKTNHGIKIANIELIPTITHLSKDSMTTFLLKDYNIDLCYKNIIRLNYDDLMDILEE